MPILQLLGFFFRNVHKVHEGGPDAAMQFPGSY